MRWHENRRTPADSLREISIFKGCTDRQLQLIDRLTDTSTALPGRVLVREGKLGRECFLIVSGRATVTRRGRLVTTLGPGDYFGEIGAIDIGHRTATLTAISTLTVLIIGPREFSTLLADIPGFRDALLRGMARRLRSADDTIDRMRLEVECEPAAEIIQFDTLVSAANR